MNPTTPSAPHAATAADADHITALLKDSYERVAYDSLPLPATEPAHLHTVAALMGLPAPDPRTARVLEIGCASGGNLLPLALRYPGATFVGIDLSESQIEDGRRCVQHAGVSNLRLEALNVQHLPSDLGQFDYIVCHGVYSWVPDAVRADILRVCRQHLSPTGLAVISLNMYPGWKPMEALRDAMLWRARLDPAAEPNLDQALDMLRWMHATGAESAVLRHQLDDFLRSLPGLRRSYLVHEFMEDCNQPRYFHQWAAELEAAGLAFAAESEWWVSFTDSLGADALAPWADQLGQRLVVEQLMDYARNRRFRQSVIVQAEQRARLPTAAQARPARERLAALHVAGQFRPLAVEQGSNASLRFANSRGEPFDCFVAPAMFGALVDTLNHLWPATCTVPVLLERMKLAQARALQAGHVAPGAESGLAPDELAWRVLEYMVAQGHVRLRSLPVCAQAPADDAMQARWHLPRSTCVQAGWISNLWHEPVQRDPWLDQALPLLQRPEGASWDEVVVAWLAAIERGAITLRAGERHLSPATDADAVAQTVFAALAQVQAALRACGLERAAG